ncbi:MAG: hypothetical protein ABIP17_10000 [Ilumatobacteraceae bacterium]
MSVRPLAGLLFLVSLAGSCSAGGPDEIMLVSREWPDLEMSCDGNGGFSCRYEGPSQTFRDADGHVVTVAVTDAVWHLEILSTPEVECGGEMIRRRTYIYRLADAGPDETVRHTLVFEDGSAVQLFVDSYFRVVDQCLETVGRWEGVNGTFEGRTGTYRWTDNWVQHELVLTDT